MERIHDPAIQLLGNYPKTTKTLTQRSMYGPMFTAALIVIFKIWKQPKHPLIDEQVQHNMHIQLNITPL